jgi:hypothetical protein
MLVVGIVGAVYLTDDLSDEINVFGLLPLFLVAGRLSCRTLLRVDLIPITLLNFLIVNQRRAML